MLVLTETKLTNISDEVDVIKIQGNDVEKYNNQDVDIIVCCRKTACKVSNMNFPKLKLIQLTSAGFDGVPLEKFAKKGIDVANAGSVYSIPISETVVYGILQMSKRYHENPKKHGIRIARNYKHITELAGKTVTILGTGSIGGEIAKRLQPFDMTIYGYSKTGEEKECFAENTNKISRLKNMLAESQYVISTLPDTPELNGFINVDLLTCMKSDTVFLNVGRRTVINEEDLYQALKRRAIGGAVLDIFEKVPNPLTNKFRRLSNTIVWPGVSAISQEVAERLETHIRNNILKVACSEKPNCIVNGE